MWLLKFHISVCILCWIAVKAMEVIFRDRYKRYEKAEEDDMGEELAWCVCPILNMAYVLIFLYAALVSDEKAEKMK